MSDESEKDKAVIDLIRENVVNYAERVVFGTASEAQRESVVGALADAFKRWHEFEVECREKGEREPTEREKEEIGRFRDKVQKLVAEHPPGWGASVKQGKERSCSHPTYRRKS